MYSLGELGAHPAASSQTAPDGLDLVGRVGAFPSVCALDFEIGTGSSIQAQAKSGPPLAMCFLISVTDRIGENAAGRRRSASEPQKQLSQPPRNPTLLNTASQGEI